jgi:hypothetical protein
MAFLFPKDLSDLPAVGNYIGSVSTINLNFAFSH